MESGEIGISHPAYTIRIQKIVWTAVRKASGLATDNQTDLSSGVNDDFIVSDVK